MSRESRQRELNHGTARTLAATVGTVPLAIVASVALALVLPDPYRVALGVYAVFPTWVAASTLAFLCPDGKRAWGLVVGATLLAAVVAAAALWLRGSGA